MCGITGWYRRSGRPAPKAVIEAQNKTIFHRGPDESGVYCDGDFGFGMQRLSILDLKGGHQPIISADGDTVIVFNGEIYNHPALRRELEAAGFSFRTTTDTETILNGFLHWGDEVWPRLEGMYAVAIWRRNERVLRLARDPLGIKPLFVTEQDNGLAFASEIKALLQTPGHIFSPDDKAVHDFFCFGHTLPDRTIYKEVRRIPPGHLMTIAQDGPPSLKAFWRFSFKTAEAASEQDWIEAFRSEWTACVERHMLSDVPVGVFLSGGVDSSAVAAAMAQTRPERLKAFTIGFPVPRYDETPHAAQLAAHLGFEHVTRRVEATDAADILPKIVACHDEPFADPSSIPTWYLSKLAAEHVKVVLAGDGGDELFAGYTRHLNERFVEAFHRLPPPLRALGGAVNLLPPLPHAGWNYQTKRLQRLRRDAMAPRATFRFFSKNAYTSPAFRESIYTEDFNALWNDADYSAFEEEFFPDTVSNDPVEQFLYADTTVRLQSVMLTKVDRASMDHSLEVRVPFLSHTFADWASSVPVDLKLKGRTGKHIVRQAIAPWLPPQHLNRPKQGFSMPLAEWVRGDFGHYVEDVWKQSGAAASGYLNPAAIDNVFADHRSGRADHSLFLYALAVFSLWWEGRP